MYKIGSLFSGSGGFELADIVFPSSERWRQIEDYENYAVSETGKVYNIITKHLMTSIKTQAGYLRVHLSQNGRHKKESVHRLVANAFIPNPQKKPTVNHINEIKTDNRVQNLEWATHQEQNNHGTRTKRAMENTNWERRSQIMDYSAIAKKHNYKNLAKKLSIPIYQLTKKGDIIRKWDGISMAARNIGANACGIVGCCKGYRKTCKGYRWKYAEDPGGEIY